MEYINKKTNIDASYNSRSESRFKVFLSLLRTAGIEPNIKPVTKVNFVCSAIIILCYHVSIVSFFTDTFVNRYHFGKLIATQIVTWTHFSLRYADATL
jgi:hypothetical protein